MGWITAVFLVAFLLVYGAIGIFCLCSGLRQILAPYFPSLKKKAPPRKPPEPYKEPWTSKITRGPRL